MDKKEYDRNRYQQHIRPKLFENRKCRVCEILLASKYGAKGTYKYCRSCKDSGAADRDVARRYYKRNRKKIIQRVTSYQRNSEKRKAYMKDYGKLRTFKR